MARIIITIETPESAQVAIEAPEPGDDGGGDSDANREQIRVYVEEFLPDNGKMLLKAEAEQQIESGPFTFQQIADRLGETESRALALNRNLGRGAAAWRRRTGTEAPVGLEMVGWQGDRKSFRLPDGVPEIILSLI